MKDKRLWRKGGSKWHQRHKASIQMGESTRSKGRMLIRGQKRDHKFGMLGRRQNKMPSSLTKVTQSKGNGESLCVLYIWYLFTTWHITTSQRNKTGFPTFKQGFSCLAGRAWDYTEGFWSVSGCPSLYIHLLLLLWMRCGLEWRECR